MVTNIGEKVQQFYNKSPFPDYELDSFRNKSDLELSAWSFARLLDRSISVDASIIDVGTGTGQLSAFLSLRRSEVYGIDFSEGSLKKAKALKSKLGLETLKIHKVDILSTDDINKINKKFDIVLCLGVLHHTGDAYIAFKNVLRFLKPGGYIAVGLYNKVGRIPLKIRRFLSKTIYKNNLQIKDRFIKMQIGEVEDKERARGWWNDQYKHPHETSHSLGEVLGWFKSNNIEFCESLPSANLLNQSDVEIAGLWNDNFEKAPNFIERILIQIKWVFTTNKEGGYWITFGRKIDEQ